MNDPEITTIANAMAAKGYIRADLGRLLGLDSAQVSRVFAGKRRIQIHEDRAIREWLGLAPGQAHSASGQIIPMPGMVPLYGWVGAQSDGRLTFAEQSIRGFVPMLPAQAHMRDAFALEVSDVSMAPRYEPGEIVYVAPNRWPARGQDCVVVKSDNEGLLKRFLRRDSEKVELFQLNPEREIEVSLKHLASIHTVIGRG